VVLQQNIAKFHHSMAPYERGVIGFSRWDAVKVNWWQGAYAGHPYYLIICGYPVFSDQAAAALPDEDDYAGGACKI
jgi:hypothetical protein